jgi:subtilisin family serine protease
MAQKIIMLRKSALIERAGGLGPSVMERTIGAVSGIEVEDLSQGLLPPLHASLGEAVMVVADVKDSEAINRLAHDYQSIVEGVFADLPIGTAAVCEKAAIGTEAEVAEALHVATLHKRKLDGRGVRLAVVDTGLSQGQLGGTFGHAWHPSDPSYAGGTSRAGHGTMVAGAARLCAPAVALLDYALLKSTGSGLTAWLSDAIRAMNDLIEQVGQDSSPLIVNNSWCLYDRTADAQVGTPENYAENPLHPAFTVVGDLVEAGAVVLFAAGNCGGDCPDGRCTSSCIGPGKSIFGVNSHPDAITVGAVSKDSERLGMSAQGPGLLARAKPDVCGYGQFAAMGGMAGGTSAAAGIVSGVAAALCSHGRIDPARLKAALNRTAFSRTAFDYELGHGIVRPVAAADVMGLP